MHLNLDSMALDIAIFDRNGNSNRHAL